MRVSLPDNLNDITLGKYQDYMKLDSESENYTDEIFSLFTDIPLSQVKEVPKKQYDEVLQQIYNALQERDIRYHSFYLRAIYRFNSLESGTLDPLKSSSYNSN